MKNAGYFRVDVWPAPDNGLKVPSQVMVDKLFTVPCARIGRRLGHVDVDNETLAQVTQALSLCLGIAEPN